MDLRRVNPGQSGEIARHHQSLEYDGHRRDRGFGRPRRAGRPCLWAPPNRRVAGGVVIQRVEAQVIGAHQGPEAADIFAPADDLADEALDGLDRGGACVKGGLGPRADLGRGEETEIEIGRDQRVRQEGIAGQHRILFGAKARQGMGEEVIQRLQGLRAGDGPAKGDEASDGPRWKRVGRPDPARFG